MSERPILFSGAMVRAILEGGKTQTRRVVGGLSKRFPLVKIDAGGRFDDPMAWGWKHAEDGIDAPLGAWIEWCPYGVAGDRLWVRENGWQRPERTPKMMREGADTWEPYYFDADLTPEDHAQFKEWGFKRRPSIHMPRSFCRLVLEVTGVRIQRLQDIDTGDCEAEGCGNVMPFSAQQMYRQLWISINGIASWNDNPWVWVVEFKSAHSRNRSSDQ